LSSPSFNEKTTAGLEGGEGNGLDSKVYLFILDSRQLEVAVGSNDLFISCHVLGSVDAMLRFIHAVGLLKLAVLVPVHPCTQQIILVFVCGTYVPTLAYLWYLV
jgi:hypothetical protein